MKPHRLHGLSVVVVAAALALPQAHAQAPAQTPAVHTGAQDFAKQCSACHMAYPPQLLPARSWQAIIGHLRHHFGEDASLGRATTARILTYAVGHAADSPFGNPEILRGLPSAQTPLRITDLPIWKRIHDRFLLSGQMTLAPGRLSAANCSRCHGSGGGGGEGGGEGGN
ncbi:MAG TPA: hypothetical protein VMU82_03530 [Acetobacteraceae bacterium]|nr:hypothetical protein [Acetobacteraceae bacterium]